MEKIALIELGTMQIKLSIIKIEPKQFFEIEKEFAEPSNLGNYIENKGIIKEEKIQEIISMLRIYKEIAESMEIKDFRCIASAHLAEAKNHTSFLNELNFALGLDFKCLTPEQESDALFYAVLNTLDIPKGLIISVSGATTKIMYHSRRALLANVTIPIGADNIKSISDFNSELAAAFENIKEFDPETQIIGSGDIFNSFSRLSRKKKRYVLNVSHNYTSDRTEFVEIAEFLKSCKYDADARLRDAGDIRAGYLISGMDIAIAVMDFTKLNSIVINKNGRNVGIAYDIIFADCTEKIVPDVVLHSLETIMWGNACDERRAVCHYSLVNALYKQLRVLHKLPRSYARILKPVSFLYNIGSCINKLNFNQLNYRAVLDSNLMGLTHRELLLTAFIVSRKGLGNFSALADWVMNKDLWEEGDEDAISKLSVIVAMADAMNVRANNVIKDINCDVLGDSVIVKLVTDTDFKNLNTNVNASRTEIFYAKKYIKQFAKVFKKKVEIL
jgi:exopolyphosphatase/guanosine-5'-triphosphate,3'-diphosphate pyrophosphatase